MPDSGIAPPKEVIDTLWEMKETAKNKYDYVVVNMQKLPSKGSKLDFEIALGKTQDVGEAEKKYEGQDLHGEDVVFRAVKDMLLSEYKDDACFVQFFLNYNLEGNRPQNKLMFLTWIPETTMIKKKMVMTSTCKGLVKKAPHGTLGHTVNDADDLNFKEFTVVASAGKAK